MLFAALALLGAFRLVHAQTSSAATGVACVQTGFETLTTDRANYNGGDTTHISGTGYSSACDVTVDVTRPDGVVETAIATTDPLGSLAYDYVIPGPPSIQGDYRVDAVGLGDAVLASTTFSDALTVNGDIVPSYVPGAVSTSFRVLFRNVCNRPSTREVDVKLPAGYTSASVDGATFSDGGTWSAVTPQSGFDFAFALQSGSPLYTARDRLGSHRHHCHAELPERFQLECRRVRQRGLYGHPQTRDTDTPHARGREPGAAYDRPLYG